MDPTSVRHALRKGLLNPNPPTNQSEMAPPPYTASAPLFPNVGIPSSQLQPQQITTLLPEQDVDNYLSDDDDEDDDEHAEAPLHFSIDTATTVEGTGNRISVSRIDGPRLGHLIHGVLTSQRMPNRAQQLHQTTTPSSPSEQRIPYSNRRINITINCGITVTGNSNVVMLTAPGVPTNSLGAASSAAANGTAVQKGDENLPDRNERKRMAEHQCVGAPSAKCSRRD